MAHAGWSVVSASMTYEPGYFGKGFCRQFEFAKHFAVTHLPAARLRR
jgi:hypothetical protein